MNRQERNWSLFQTARGGGDSPMPANVGRSAEELRGQTACVGLDLTEVGDKPAIRTFTFPYTLKLINYWYTTLSSS